MGLLDFLTATKRPPAGTAVCSAEALRERLLELNRLTAPWRVIDGAAEGVDLIAEWKIVDAAWYEIFSKAGLERVFTFSLRLDPARHEVRVQDREWRVAWEAGVPTLALGRGVAGADVVVLRRRRVRLHGDAGAGPDLPLPVRNGGDQGPPPGGGNRLRLDIQGRSVRETVGASRRRAPQRTAKS